MSSSRRLSRTIFLYCGIGTELVSGKLDRLLNLFPGSRSLLCSILCMDCRKESAAPSAHGRYSQRKLAVLDGCLQMDEVLDGLGHLWATLTSGQLQFVLEWCRVARIHIDYRLPSTICIPKKETPIRNSPTCCGPQIPRILAGSDKNEHRR